MSEETTGVAAGSSPCRRRACKRSSADPSEVRAALVAELRSRCTCSIEEAAVLLGIGRSTAYAAARDHSLPTLRLSHRLLVPTAKLFAMLGIEDDT